MTLSHLLFPLASKWIAGEYLEQAMEQAAHSNRKGYRAMMNLLGEHVERPKKAVYYLHHYIELLHEMNNHQIKGAISVKPSQLGMLLGKEICRNNLSQILEVAKAHEIPVWLDMEHAVYVPATLDLYRSLLPQHPSLGICLQANLKRTEEDLPQLMTEKANIRLVKGAYKENPAIAHMGDDAIRKQYKHLMKLLFLSTQKHSYTFAIGTHDKELIEAAVKLSKNALPRYEFQLLRGIGNPLKRTLVQEGFTVSEYIPYGREWMPYVFRRVREKNHTLLLALRSLLER